MCLILNSIQGQQTTFVWCQVYESKEICLSDLYSCKELCLDIEEYLNFYIIYQLNKQSRDRRYNLLHYQEWYSVCICIVLRFIDYLHKNFLVKVKIGSTHTKKASDCSGGITSPILNLGPGWSSPATLVTYSIGGWVNTRAGLGVLEKE